MGNKDIFVTLKCEAINVECGIKYENKDFIVVTNQELYDLNQQKLSIEEVLGLYNQNIELGNVISNTFTILIIDKRKNKINCIQDINGDTIPIYYYKNDEGIIISNKLINIINGTSKTFKMNKRVIGYFLRKGFIHNKETLVKDIYKLVPKYNLEIDLYTKKERTTKKKIKYTKLNNYNTDLYIKEFEKILKVNEKNRQSYVTLSNGYDSNFIFSFLDKNKNIEAFSVGGIAGRDETKDVKNNVKDYKNTNLNIAYVSEKTLDIYPDLIYKLEGAIYEGGIFLQYELANTIKSIKVESAILFAGEGADQIFCWGYFNKIQYLFRCAKYILKTIKDLNFGDIVRNLNIKAGILGITDQYKMLTYIIMKKNGILMNDIGIDYIYPFLSRNIIDIAYSTRYTNLTSKKSHINACNKQIDSNILKNIAKIGGSTDSIALLKNCEYVNELEEWVKKSKYNCLRISRRKFSNNYKEYLLKVLYLEVFEYLFIENASEIEYKKKMELREIMKEKYSNNEETTLEVAF